MKLSLSIFCFLIISFGFTQEKQNNNLKSKEKYIDKQYWKNFSYNSDSWQIYLDSALKIEPNNAYFWQQKAMPYLKNGNYSEGMKFLNLAVHIDEKAYVSYRAFIKCVFLKDYNNALIDFEKAVKHQPDANLMDHNFSFWIGLCNLKLNDFKTAEKYFEKSINIQKVKGLEWVHYIDYFYLGLTMMKMKKINKANHNFNSALAIFIEFPEALYYKGIICIRKGRLKGAKENLIKAKNSLESGNKINEDNEVYVNYPFQITLYEVNELLDKL
ncbi:MAG: hypothetical protein IPQ23_11350 [Cytophagaceae bacterium]|nr:hypothetical protein [Cytophagaceae bacterium]